MGAGFAVFRAYYLRLQAAPVYPLLGAFGYLPLTPSACAA